MATPDTAAALAEMRARTQALRDAVAALDAAQTPAEVQLVLEGLAIPALRPPRRDAITEGR